MSKKALMIVGLIVLTVITVSYQAGLHIQNYRQVQEIGETNVNLLSLLTKPSDFNANEISWEKANYQLAIITFDKQEIGRATSIMPGKQTGKDAGFVFIHEIIVYAEGKVPNNNPSEYFNPDPRGRNVVFPGIEINNQNYCWSSELDYLSECSITVKNTKIISTFTIRIFEPDDQVAFEILPSVIAKFIDRLAKSEYGK